MGRSSFFPPFKLPYFPPTSLNPRPHSSRYFSPQGLVSPWYTFPTLQKFKNITQCYEKEYNATSWVVGKVLRGVGGLDAAVDGWRVERQGLGGAEKNGRLFGVGGKGWS